MKCLELGLEKLHNHSLLLKFISQYSYSDLWIDFNLTGTLLLGALGGIYPLRFCKRIMDNFTLKKHAVGGNIWRQFFIEGERGGKVSVVRCVPSL